MMLREVAVLLATRFGWPCFPLAGKVPLKDSHGFLDASCDPAVLARMFSARRITGIGVATGGAHLLVVDLDGIEAVQAWRDLASRYGEPDPGPVVRSPGGPHRFHLYFDGHNPRARSTSRGVVGPLIETKAAGRYVAVPPSKRGERRYEWACWAWPLPPPPTWLLERTEPPPPLPAAAVSHQLVPGGWATPYGLAALAGILDEITAAVPGTRNDTLNRRAFRCGRLIAAGQLDDSVVRRELVAAAVTSYGCSEKYAEAVVKSAIEAGSEYPVRIEDRP